MPERLVVPVRVIPRSRTERIDAVRAGRLVLRVAAAPESGAANRAAQALLAGALGLRIADVELERGSTSRDKSFTIPKVARDALSSLLGTPAAGGTAAEHAQSRDRTRRGAAHGG